MEYSTLDVIADRGGKRSSAPRVTTTTYLDGYDQDVKQGLKGRKGSVDFTYTEDYALSKAVEDFLNKAVEANVPFWYSFYKEQEPLRLYKVDSEVSFTHVGGDTFAVTTTFKEYEGL